jgi:Ca2+-binding RTX toxin-like protein
VTYTLSANVENLTLTGTGNINATGNTLDNILTGNSGANTLSGGAGTDTMLGGAGDDTYVVDAAGDVVAEAVGEGADLVQSSVTYTLSANVENLTLTGTTNIDATGNALDNTLTGNTGNNIIDGGAGNDTMVGGTGNDTYVVDAAGDVVTETSSSGGTDTVLSSVSYTLGANVENLTLTGLDNINATGNTLANTLTGNAGDNILSGGTGNDTMVGGAGNDTYVVDATGDVVTEQAGQGTDTVQSSVTYTLSADVENLTLTGTGNVNATGNTLDNTLIGNSGANTLSGGAGNDTMLGGAGNDTYVVDAAGDVVTEAAGEGTDLVQSSVSYALSTNVENLTLTGTANIDGTGNALANTLTGNAGNNILDGGAGTDTMLGGAGDDTYVVDATTDVVTEASNQGTDLIQSSVTYTLSTNVETLTLTGTGNINATGNTLDNILTGNAGNNTLNGGTGNDTMVGGAGNDTLIGGTGDDIFIYAHGHGSDSVNGGTGGWTDTIVLDQSGGPLQMGADWTLNLTSGTIVSQTAHELTFSADADGTLNFTDGSTMSFTDIERVQW